MVLVLALQVLVFNHIHLLGYVTPLFIGYMILPFHRGSNRIALLLWGFFTGLLFDSFSNTAGMASASCTLLAMLQPALLSPFIPRDATEDFSPTIKTLGFWKYILYSIISMLILHAVFYALDAFTISNWQLTLMSIGIGTVLTSFIVLIAELFYRKK